MLWSYVASGISVALWIMLVVVNRATSGEVRPDGLRADLLALVIPLSIALGVFAVLFAVIALVRSRAKGNAFVALLLAIFVGAAAILQTYW